MTPPLVATGGGVTLIGGGEVEPADIDGAVALAPLVVAADSGADRALAHGLMPAAVIGDFDSISDAARAVIPAERLHPVPEQDSTDFEKCLTRISARFVLALGFTGARLDHTLAAVSVLARVPAPPVLLIGPADVAFLAPPRLHLPLDPGTRVSLWPLGPALGTSLGLRWPIDGIDFAPAGAIGTSNEATGPVTLALDGRMLVLLPRPWLSEALRAMI
ncbi:thiamine diphosphokinase [Paracoccus sp. S-4012]|uniref:thiamine diphosphokinase n=1 Tax=Paracoccus sp. S-4012 TaxID=2665648 RepID=UPI0012AFD4E5|nr:thiamine diphosphokinase [Paracoccus sp. S-4012]MRX50796.1 thiamine diphosphokinase [Paracoccus sp. S-4012]